MKKSNKKFLTIIITAGITLYIPLSSNPIATPASDVLPMAHMINSFLLNNMSHLHEILKTHRLSLQALYESKELLARSEEIAQNTPTRSTGTIQKTHYEILGVPSDASLEMINAARDKVLTEIESSPLDAELKTLQKNEVINAAFVLSDDSQRKAYEDAHIDYIISECLERNKNNLCGEHDHFMSLLYHHKSFLEPMFSAALGDSVQGNVVEKPFMIQFLHNPTFDRNFFHVKITTLPELIKLSEEISTFASKLKKSLSDETKRHYNSWIKQLQAEAHSSHEKEKSPSA